MARFSARSARDLSDFGGEVKQLTIDYAVPFQHLEMLKNTMADRTDPDLGLHHSKHNPVEVRIKNGRMLRFINPDDLKSTVSEMLGIMWRTSNKEEVSFFIDGKLYMKYDGDSRRSRREYI